MADYYLQFSCIFDVGSAENATHAADIRREMEKDVEDEDDSKLGLSFSMERDPGTSPGALWIYAEENGEPEQVITFVLRCAEAMHLTGRWGFTWALTCSKPRLDGYGGGAQVVDLGKHQSIDWIDCDRWVAEQTEAAVDGDAPDPDDTSNPESPSPAAPDVVAGQGGAA